MKKNERNAGRKPLPYKTMVKRIPVDLESAVNKLIEQYKLTEGKK